MPIDDVGTGTRRCRCRRSGQLPVEAEGRPDSGKRHGTGKLVPEREILHQLAALLEPSPSWNKLKSYEDPVEYYVTNMATPSDDS